MNKRKKQANKEETPAKSLLWGAFLLCGAVAAYFYIGNAEQTGHSFTLPIILDPVYRLIGKWGIVGVLVLGAAGWFWSAISKMRQQARARVASEPTTSTSTSEFPPA